MDPLDAALAVLREEARPLHWTVIQDRALRRGYLDPFAVPDVRRELLAALARGAREGRVIKVDAGVYAAPPEDAPDAPRSRPGDDAAGPPHDPDGSGARRG